MEYDRSAWVATSYRQPFAEAAAWRDMAASRAGHLDATFSRRPLGAGIIHSLFENELDDALGCYRTQSVRRIGGWDPEGDARGVDWAMYLKILNHGERILVIPSVDYLYCRHGDPMFRTGTEFSGDRLKARALILLPPFERYRLIALAKEVEGRPSAEAEDVERLRAELEELKSKTPPLRHRAIDRMVQLAWHVPLAERAFAWTLRRSYHLWIWASGKRSRD
jgi:hypothetical protein